MKTALIVIDMQNDYLWEKRKSRFSYDTPKLVGAVNGLIRRYAAEGSDVIYIRHIIQNLPTNRLLFGYSIAGTEGAALYSGLEKVSDLCFDKLVGDALTNRELLERVRAEGYEELHLCGLDEFGCVANTALGASKRGITARILREGTATVMPEGKADKMKAKLQAAKIEYI
jgi:nicotinamidase-related amidase